MSSFVFLAIAAGVFTVGCLIVWLRHRDRTTLTTSIDEFSSEMGALSPESESDPRRSRY
jgi:hypothetical protein